MIQPYREAPEVPVQIPGPVFVTGFSRGGTTLLMDLLASHPDLCTVGEIHQLFKGSNLRDHPLQIAWKALTRDLPAIVASRQDLLSPRHWQPRGTVSAFTIRHVARVLEHSKRSSDHEHLNRFKGPGDPYQPCELEDVRLLGKTLDGTVQLSSILRAIYPHAHFVGLVRNGLAVCEGHVRRGRSARQVGRLYQTVVDRMLQDTETFPSYTLVRFEELLRHPWNAMQHVYGKLQLDPQRIRHIRVQQRRRMNGRGEHCLEGGCEWEVRWLKVADLQGYVDPQVDQNQLRLLSDRDRDEFLQEAETAMHRLGYATTLTS